MQGEVLAPEGVGTDELQERESRIERALRHAWYETALEYQAIRDKHLYRKMGWPTWAAYCDERWNRTAQHIDQQIARADEVRQIVEISTISVEQLPASMSHATELAKLHDAKQRAQVWGRVLALGVPITARIVEGEVGRYQAELNKNWYTLAEWQVLSDDERGRVLTQPYANDKQMNATNDNIEWAAWSWNPVTGCEHECPYCYARDIAKRFYPYGFTPAFLPDRLTAPMNTKPGQPRWVGDLGYKGVFVCSMADLFGWWVPQEWIDAVLETVRQTPQWTYIFLTKNPDRMVGIDWPENAWVGATVDCQERVVPAWDAFRRIKAPVRFVSCEPLNEAVYFEDMSMFDWVLIGGRSESSGAPAFQPDWAWVEDLLITARRDGCAVYFKTNLEVRPREYPGA